MTSASVRTRASLPETSSLVIALKQSLMVDKTNSSRARIASVKSCLSESFSPMAQSSHIDPFALLLPRD
ncbi:unannotated protein [freshwater metagenome]|uniref:Unannotated protein n=1 Tax=freshwater metagenome TaxID=449393 RepID=A0A6J7SDA7_9ZZZZ